MLETLQDDFGCNRRVEGLCSCVSYKLVHLEVRYVKLNLAIQWTLDYPDLDYPDPRLSGSRTEIIARAYNNLRMRVVAVDKKLLNQLFCQLKIVRLLDKAVYHSAPLVARPVHSSWLFSSTGKRIWPIISLVRTFHLSGMVFLRPKGSG